MTCFDLVLGTWNVGTPCGRAGEIVETLNWRKIDICCVQEVQWQGTSTRNGGVDVFVAKKWIEKVLEVKCVSNRLMVIKLYTDKRTVVVVSGYAPQQGFANDKKDCFCENIIQLIASVNEKDMIIIGGDLNGHVGKDMGGYDGVYGGYVLV